MSGKIIVFLTAVVACLLLVLGYKEWRINSLESQKNDLKSEICKRDDIIAQKESYIAQYNDALTNHFLVGVKTLSDSIESFKGNKTDNMYLSTYGDAGKELYNNLL